VIQNACPRFSRITLFLSAILSARLVRCRRTLTAGWRRTARTI